MASAAARGRGGDLRRRLRPGGAVRLAGWTRLSEAGVGAAGAAVLPLATLHHAGNLQARHHRESSVPYLQGAAHDQSILRPRKNNISKKSGFEKEAFLTMKAGITGCWNFVLKVCISCLVLAL